jgi:phage tail tape-measure protein
MSTPCGVVGAEVIALLGPSVGIFVGTPLGKADTVGDEEGRWEGAIVGVPGGTVGFGLGAVVGLSVGEEVGKFVGEEVGKLDGNGVGSGPKMDEKMVSVSESSHYLEKARISKYILTQDNRRETNAQILNILNYDRQCCSRDDKSKLAPH